MNEGWQGRVIWIGLSGTVGFVLRWFDLARLGLAEVVFAGVEGLVWSELLVYWLFMARIGLHGLSYLTWFKLLFCDCVWLLGLG